MSGGGDSMAMLHLAAGLDVRVVTVDHGLRPEAAAEAAEVGRVCASLGVPHDTLQWQWDRRGNLQDAARRGRRRVIADWARTAGLGAVALAHTRDDVAETFLMRLARGAGVDGLSAMAHHWREGGVTWLRPLLGASRAELRDYLRAIGADWVDDPSNDNTAFDRIKARKALTALRPLGLTEGRLAEVAGHLAEARAALETVTDDVAVRVLAAQGNAVRVDATGLATAPAEVQRRLILRVLGHLAPGDYGPRGAALQALLARVLAGQAATLAGCRMVPDVRQGVTWAFREFKAVAGLTCPIDQWWDGMWRIDGPSAGDVRALSVGIARIPDWRKTGLPRAALLASPSLWQGDHLIAAPHAGFGLGHSAIPLFPATRLHHSGFLH